MRIVLISLERAKQRRDVMMSQFDAMGLNYEVLSATDWKGLAQADWDLVDEEIRRKEGRQPYPLGAIACWLSHRRALINLAENGPEMMAVFEDDAALGKNLMEVLYAIENLKHSFDIIFLARLRTKNTFVNMLPLTSEYMLGRVRYIDHGAMGYVITRAAATRLLVWAPRVIYLIDQALRRYWEHGLDAYTLSPSVVFHEDAGHSLIGESSAPCYRYSRYHPARVIRRLHTLARDETGKRLYFKKQGI